MLYNTSQQSHTHAGGGRRHACRLGVLVDCRARNQTNNLLIIGRPRSLLSQFNGPGQNAVSGPLVLTQHKNTNLKVPIKSKPCQKVVSSQMYEGSDAARVFLGITV